MTGQETTATAARADTATAVAKLIRFLETNVVPDGLFGPDVFTDLTLPHWRIQATTADEVAAIRIQGHSSPGQVRVTRVDPTDRGFIIEFEERWHNEGQQWYCREMIRADLTAAGISELSIYCTGDWDEAKQREHAAAVQLVRP
ncbi:hypothetical protein [Kribbella sp. NPDC055071]